MPSSLLSRLDGVLSRVGRSRPTVWPTGRRVVSFTFDDFPASAGENGGVLLESFGFRGTFYSCMGRLGAPSESGLLSTLDGVVTLCERGHEVGCHTADHVDCRAASASAVLTSIERNRALARRAGLPDFRSFAYPYGQVALSKRKLVARRFRTARGARAGINRGVFDAGNLRATPLMARDGLEVALAHVRQLANSEGWLVLYSHDVKESPSMWGCQQDDLSKVCRLVADAGLEVLPVGFVLE